MSTIRQIAKHPKHPALRRLPERNSHVYASRSVVSIRTIYIGFPQNVRFAVFADRRMNAPNHTHRTKSTKVIRYVRVIRDIIYYNNNVRILFLNISLFARNSFFFNLRKNKFKRVETP